MLRLLCVLASISTMVFAISFSPDVIGSGSKSEDAPWIVSLQMEEGDYAYCGATIIKSIQNGEIRRNGEEFTATCDGWIVTAASCLSEMDKIIVTLGELNLEKMSENKMQWEVNENDIHINPHYDEETHENDIGLIQVSFSQTTTEWKEVETLCDDIPVLPYWSEHELNETDFSRINASVHGWGLKVEDGPLQKELYNATVVLKTDKECSNVYQHLFFPASMICTGSNEQALSGPCSYDTGGPLTCHYQQDGNETIHTFICGIASFGLGCGRNPAVFTDIVNFEDWIDEQIFGPSDDSSTTVVPTTTGSGLL